MESSLTPTAPSIFPSGIGYFSWELGALIYSYATLFSYKFSVNPLFVQNTRGKKSKNFFEEQDTALLLFGIGFILLFYFTCQYFLGMTPEIGHRSGQFLFFVSGEIAQYIPMCWEISFCFYGEMQIQVRSEAVPQQNMLTSIFIIRFTHL